MTRCSRCYRDATIRLIGEFQNGRPATDERCEKHAPMVEDVGLLLTRGSDGPTFRLRDIRSILPEFSK